MLKRVGKYEVKQLLGKGASGSVYLAGRDQAFRNAARERAEMRDLRIKARPASHEVTEAGVKKAA